MGRWAYHGTPAELVPAIARGGLRVDPPGRHGGGDWAEGSVFFSPSPYTASIYGGSEGIGNAPFPFGVLLRFAWPEDAFYVGDETGENAFISQRSVPPQDIEYYAAPVPGTRHPRLRKDLWRAVSHAEVSAEDGSLTANLGQPPPPPPRRRSSTLEKLRRIERRERESPSYSPDAVADGWEEYDRRVREEAFDPEAPPERYARAHHFAVNPQQVTEDELDMIVGERVDFDDPWDQLVDEYRTWGTWRKAKKGDWLIPDLLNGSDYSGGYVTRANYETFLEDWDKQGFVLTLRGGHGTYGIAVHIPSTPRQAWEQIFGLSNYSLLSDDKLAQLEMEGADAAWESWAKSDYLKLWREATEEDERFADDWMDDISDDAWREHFEACASAANVYWEAQGDTPEMHIDVQRVFDQCSETPPEPVGGVPDPYEAAILGVGPDPEASTLDERRRRHIEQLRAELDRPYRRFESNPPRRVNDFLRTDPYKNLAIPELSNTYYSPMYEPGMVVQNVTHDIDPSLRAILYCQARDSTHFIVAWWKTGTGSYELGFFDPKNLPKELLTMGTVAEVGEASIDTPSEQKLTTENDWDIVLRSMHHYLKSSGGGGGGEAVAIYMRWYDDAQLPGRPTLWSYANPAWPHVAADQLQFVYAPVFQRYAEREQQIESIMTELGMRSPAPEPEEEPERVLEPSRSAELEARRRRFIEYARAELDRPYQRRFEPNAALHPAQAACRHPKAYRDRGGQQCSVCGAAKVEGRWQHLRPEWFIYYREGGPMPEEPRYLTNAPRVWEVYSADDGLEGAFGDEAQAERYAETLRTELGVRARVVEKMSGGLAEGMSPEQFDPVELARGTFVEMEHTGDVDTARSIAMDHLVEDPLYYQKLQVAGL